MSGGRSSEGWAGGGAKRDTPCTTTSPPAIFILNTMSCIVIIMYAIVIEPNIIRTAEVVYSMGTLVVNVSQLLALPVFHIRLAARIPLDHDGSLWPLCLLRYVLFAFCRTSSIAINALHDANWSKLRIVLFFDMVGLTQKM